MLLHLETSALIICLANKANNLSSQTGNKSRLLCQLWKNVNTALNVQTHNLKGDKDGLTSSKSRGQLK